MQKKISPSDIIADAEKNAKFLAQQPTNYGVLRVRTANECLSDAEKMPIPKMLFSEFWHEGELCIMFAGTNIGKSILAVQIANSISRGINISGFKLEAAAQKVLYLDFELSEKQFQNRYSIDFKQNYEFSDNFLRIEIDSDSDISESESFEKRLNDSIELTIKQTGAKILIVDNLTYLGSNSEKAKEALLLMRHLKMLKKKYNLSILALAHTPKRNANFPLSINDLQGSSMLANFIDSCFAIGASHTDKSIRYIKQLKQRATEQIYDSENVILANIEKDHNFLKFSFLSFGNETEHLRQSTTEDKKEFTDIIKSLLKSDPSRSAYSIAKELCTDISNLKSFNIKVKRIIDKIKNENKEGTND